MLPKFDAPCNDRPIDINAAINDALPHKEELIDEILAAAKRWEEGIDFTTHPEVRNQLVAVEVIGLGLFLQNTMDGLELDMSRLQLGWSQIKDLPPTQQELSTFLPITAWQLAIERCALLTWARLWWNENARQKLATDGAITPTAVKMIAMALYFETLPRQAELICKGLGLPDLQQLSMAMNLGGPPSPWGDKRPNELKADIISIVADRLNLTGKVTRGGTVPPRVSNIATGICAQEMMRRSRELYLERVAEGDWQVLIDRAMDASID